MAAYVPTTTPDASTLERIFHEIAQFTSQMGQLHGDYLLIVRNDTMQFLKLTEDMKSQMNWNGWSTLVITGFGASLSILSFAIPKAPANPAIPNPRQAAHGLSDTLSKGLQDIVEKFKDNEFLRSTANTTGLFFTNGLSQVNSSWQQAKTTDLQAKRDLIERINMQEGQAKKSIFDQQVQQCQQSALQILQSRSKGG